MENKKMIEEKKVQEEISEKTSASRRKFLKKTAYATPSLIILGGLAKPVIAAASSLDSKEATFGNRFGGNGGGPGNL